MTQFLFVQVNEEMYVAGQIDSSTVPQIVELGIKSVFNLRDESEDGYHDFPDDLPEGVERFHCPIPDNAVSMRKLSCLAV